jgi:hypothetical protein
MKKHMIELYTGLLVYSIKPAIKYVEQNGVVISFEEDNLDGSISTYSFKLLLGNIQRDVQWEPATNDWWHL